MLDGAQDNGTQLEDKTGEFPLRALLIILVYIGGLLELWNIILIRIQEHL